MKFITDSDPAAIKGSVAVDSDGDLRLTLNGVTVAYISKEVGKLFRYGVGASERKALEDAGVAFDQHGEIVLGG